MERGLAASPGGPCCRFQLPQEGRGWIHRAGPRADLAFSLLLFLMHTSPQFPQAGDRAWNREMAGRQARGGQTVARHKRTDIAGDRHLKTAAREEQRVQEERALQNHFDHFCKVETCKSGSGVWFCTSRPLLLVWVGKQLLTQKRGMMRN